MGGAANDDLTKTTTPVKADDRRGGGDPLCLIRSPPQIEIYRDFTKEAPRKEEEGRERDNIPPDNDGSGI